MKKLLAALLALAAAAPAASGQAIRFDVIDRGVPTDGVTTMHGFRGFTIRVTSEDPILRIDMQNLGLTPQGIGSAFGDLHQRWTDPTGTGNYTVTSPLSDADNSYPTELNFDSHLLPPPPEAAVRLIGEVDPHFAQRIASSPLPSTPFVGYADPPDVPGPTSAFLSGKLHLLYDIPAEADVRSVDLAYVVTDSVAGYSVLVETTTRRLGYVAPIYVPEPGGAGLLLGALAGLVVRRRRNEAGRVTMVERLEPRRLLSVAAPMWLTGTADRAGVDLTWAGVAGADGYRVERSADGVAAAAA